MDTSLSEERYLTVKLPLEQYTDYEYNFKTMEDIELYWQHLRAIVSSSKLNVKNMKSEGELLLVILQKL